MTSLINYIFEANAGLLILLVFYKIILKGETDFKLVRFFLLGGMFISVVFPLIHIGGAQQNSILTFNEIIPQNWLPEVIVTGEIYQNHKTVSYSVWKIVSLIYLSGTLLFMMLMMLRIISLLIMIYNHKTCKLDKYYVIESSENKPTFSFFKFIYVGNAGSLTQYEKERIIQHETVHARQFHSLDILVLNLFGVFFWFNPFINTYKKIFVQLHEFEADARAVENADVDKYCNLLARVALQSVDFKLANHFNNSLTLKRIEMIRTIKNKTSQWKLVSLTAYIPAMFFLLACHEQVFAQNVKPAVEMSSSNEVFSEVDQMPSYENGFENMLDFIHGEMKYPKTARKKGVEGTSYTEFIVEKNGTISEAKIIRGFNEECDAEALRVAWLLNKWNPGIKDGKAVRTKMVLPLKFKVN